MKQSDIEYTPSQYDALMCKKYKLISKFIFSRCVNLAIENIETASTRFNQASLFRAIVQELIKIEKINK